MELKNTMKHSLKEGVIVIISFILLILTAHGALAAWQTFDDFNGSSLDSTKWQAPFGAASANVSTSAVTMLGGSGGQIAVQLINGMNFNPIQYPRIKFLVSVASTAEVGGICLSAPNSTVGGGSRPATNGICEYWANQQKPYWTFENNSNEELGFSNASNTNNGIVYVIEFNMVSDGTMNVSISENGTGTLIDRHGYTKTDWNNLPYNVRFVVDNTNKMTVYEAIVDNITNATAGVFTNASFINMTTREPANQSHWNNVSAGSMHFQQAVALYDWDSASCYLYINGTMKEDWVAGGSNGNMSYNDTLLANESSFYGVDGNYTWYWNCTDTNNSIQSNVSWFVVDTVSPQFTPNSTLLALNGTTWNRLTQGGYWNVSGQFSDLNIYGTNITINSSTGVVYRTNQTLNWNNTLVNYSDRFRVSEWPNGTYTVAIAVSDDHTARTIGQYTVSKNLAARTLSVTTDSGAYIKLEGVAASCLPDSLDWAREEDRYTWSVHFPCARAEYSLTFNLTSSAPITDRTRMHPYPSFVIGKHWVDFDAENSTGYDVTQDSDGNWLVTTRTKSPTMKFRSVGGLNVVDYLYTFNLTSAPNNTKTLSAAYNYTTINLTWTGIDYNIWVGGEQSFSYAGAGPYLRQYHSVNTTPQTINSVNISGYVSGATSCQMQANFTYTNGTQLASEWVSFGNVAYANFELNNSQPTWPVKNVTIMMQIFGSSTTCYLKNLTTNRGNASGYLLYRGDTLLVNATTNTNGTVNYSDAGLVPGTTYSYRVVNWYNNTGVIVTNGTSITNENNISVTTTDPTPNPITVIAGYAANASNLNVSWTNTASGVALYRNGSLILNSTVPADGLLDTSLLENTIYQYEAMPWVSMAGLIFRNENNALLNLSTGSGALNVTVLNEVTGLPITTANITVTLISDVLNASKTTTNGSVRFTGIIAANYTIRASGSGNATANCGQLVANTTYINATNSTLYGYVTDCTGSGTSVGWGLRDTYYEVTESSTGITYVYLLNDSVRNEGIVQVRDRQTGGVEGAVVTLMRYYGASNSYATVQQATTGADGKVHMSAQAYNAYYKWSVTNDGAVGFLSTGPESLTLDVGGLWSKYFVIDTGNDLYASWRASTNVVSGVTYNPGTDTLTFTWSDPAGHFIRGCLDAKYSDGVAWKTLSNCADGTSGSVNLLLPSPDTTDYTYRAWLESSGAYSTLTVRIASLTEKVREALIDQDMVAVGVFGLVIVPALLFASVSAMAVLLWTVGSVAVVSVLGAVNIIGFAATTVIGLAVVIIGIAAFLVRR